MSAPFVLSSEGDVVVEVAGIARDILEHADERRELDALMLSDALGLENGETDELVKIFVEFKIDNGGG